MCTLEDLTDEKDALRTLQTRKRHFGRGRSPWLPSFPNPEMGGKRPGQATGACPYRRNYTENVSEMCLLDAHRARHASPLRFLAYRWLLTGRLAAIGWGAGVVEAAGDQGGVVLDRAGQEAASQQRGGGKGEKGEGGAAGARGGWRIGGCGPGRGELIPRFLLGGGHSSEQGEEHPDDDAGLGSEGYSVGEAEEGICEEAANGGCVE